MSFRLSHCRNFSVVSDSMAPRKMMPNTDMKSLLNFESALRTGFSFAALAPT